MAYLLAKITCAIVLLHTENCMSIRVKRTSQSAEIDDFINKLLTSDKMDELADKIAEKAVIKIRSLENGVSTDTYNNRLKTINKHVKPENERISSNRVKIKTYKSKIANIDTKAFIRKDSSHPNQELSLNYKYLTKKSQNKSEIIKSDSKQPTTTKSISEETSGETSDKVIVDVDLLSKNTEINSRNKAFIEDITENIIQRDYTKSVSDTSIESKKDSEESRNTNENHIIKMRFKSDQLNIFNDKIQPTKKDHTLSYEADKETIERSETAEQISTKSKETVRLQDTKEQQKDDSTERLKEKKYGKKNNKLNESGNFDEIYDKNNYILKSSEELTEGSSKKLNPKEDNALINQNDFKKLSEQNDSIEKSNTEHVIRKEGNKYFTYQSSPDYAEYHEVLQKENKNKNKFY